MRDFALISSPKDIETACKCGDLVKVLLLPRELGGRDVAENVVFVPPDIAQVKEGSTVEICAAIRAGLNEVEVYPEYRGSSFVPTKLVITAARPDAEPKLEIEIGIW